MRQNEWQEESPVRSCLGNRFFPNEAGTMDVVSYLALFLYCAKHCS
jgi:hypothetical protein